MPVCRVCGRSLRVTRQQRLSRINCQNLNSVLRTAIFLIPSPISAIEYLYPKSGHTLDTLRLKPRTNCFSLERYKPFGRTRLSRRDNWCGVLQVSPIVLTTKSSIKRCSSVSSESFGSSWTARRSWPTIPAIAFFWRSVKSLLPTTLWRRTRDSL